MEKVSVINDRQDNRLKKPGTASLKQKAAENKSMPASEGSNRTRTCVSLTFDDGPDMRYTPKILDILREFEVKATFFLVGRRVEKNPDIVMRIFEEGHDIGNHTYSHPVGPIFRYRLIEREIRLAGRAIKKITGHRPCLFRPTWSSWDMYSRRMSNIAKRLGYRSVRWSISSLDWLGIEKVIRYKILGRDINHGDIILLHDGAERFPISRRKATVELLPELLQRLERSKISPLKLSELLQIQDRPAAYF